MTDPTETLRLVPLDQLSLHPMNPRQNGSPEDARAMAESIQINGLMQNLCALETGGQIGIVAGGRRLRGLQHLAEQGFAMAQGLAPDLNAIPVRVTTDEFLARSWAGSEAASQKPLHPVDEIRAYRAMTDQGNSPNMIARAFAQTERHVRGRLALADLPAPALDALRAGTISLDVAKALTLAPEARQGELLATAVDRRWSGDSIRRELRHAQIPVTDRRVKFVGLARYIAEGGQITEDLFDDQTWLHDAPLLDRLFAEKLGAMAEQARKAGEWQWARISTRSYVTYDDREDLKPLHREPGELTEADEEEYDRLADLADGDFELEQADRDRLAELQARLDGDWTDWHRAAGGILVAVDNDGEMFIEGAYLRKEDARKVSGGDDRVEVSGGTPKPAITQAGADDLTRAATLALQTALLDKPELALDLLAWQLSEGMPGWAGPFAVQLTDQPIAPSTEGCALIDARLADTANDMRVGRADPADSFAEFTAQGRKHRNAVLTRHLARALQPHTRDPRMAGMLATLTGAQIRKVWTPDAAGYFSRLRADLLDAIWAELLELDPADTADTRVADFARLKKGEKAKALEGLMSDASVQEAHGLSRDQIKRIDTWLPAELRQERRDQDG